MKQHITPKQVSEVSKEYFYSLFEELVDRDDWADFHHKKMTIGKMIEIIDGSEYTYDIKRCKRSKNWIILEYIESEKDLNLKDRCIMDRYDSYAINSTELSDVLWEVIKQMSC
jgi:hypothetical protein